MPAQTFGEFVDTQPKQSFGDFIATVPQDVTVTKPEESDKGLVAGAKEALTTPTNWVPAAGAVAARAIGAVPSMVAGFVDSNNRHLAEDPAQAEANIRSLHTKGKEAIDAFHKGEYGQAAKHASEALGQYFGLDDQVKAINDHLSAGDERGAAGYGLGLLTQLGTAAGLNHVLGWADASTPMSKLRAAVTKVEPRIPIIKAYGPASVDLKTVDTAIRDIKGAAGDTPIKSNMDAVQAAKTYLEKNREALETWKAIPRDIKAQASGKSIGEAMLAAAGDTLQQESPEAYAAVARRAKTWDRPFGVDELEKRLKESNAKLNGFYGASTAKQNSMINSGLNVAEEEAKARELREVFYNLLDPEGKGAGPREIQQRYGGVAHFLNNAIDKETAIQGGRPVNEWEGFKQDTADPLMHVLRSMSGHTRIHKFGDVSSEDATSHIASAFKHAEAGAPHPVPPDTPPVRGYLGAGPVVTPPPEDTSFVAGVPAVAVTPTTKLLEAGKTPIVTPPPQDKSYAVGVPGVGSTRSTNQLPPATTRITEPPETSYVTAMDAAKGIQRGKDGRFYKVFSSGSKTELTPQQLYDLRARPLTIQDLMNLQKGRE